MAQQPPQLSSKDLGLFRQVVRHFESKQYKKGLKAAEQILKKNPGHADTTAMKALIIGTQGSIQEAFTLAKNALNANMKSHVCWHVYGLLYRQEKNYEESIKAYKFALRLDPESVPIQRDLAHLQVQMRDYEGYIASRKNMLQQKPGIRQNWTALAIAHHLAGEFEDAERVLTAYEDTLQKKIPRADIEHWEAVLYKNKIIAESGEVAKALEHLEAVGKKSPDVLGVMETRADYLLRLDRKSDAEAAYGELIERNPDNSAYYDGFDKARGFDKSASEEMQKAYDEIAQRHPRSDAPRRRLLDYLSGDAFKAAADSYLLRMLRKGVPSTFANIKSLYSDSSKQSIVQELVEGYAAGEISGQRNGTAEPSDKETTNFEWSVPYFLAQHYNHKSSRNLAKAFTYAEKCLVLDPKSVDFHAVKARTLKYQGRISEAAVLMEQARACDEKDRAINTKSAKYQLRNNQNEKALDIASKFTQNKAIGGPLGDMLEMQSVWYLTEDGKAYLRQRKLSLALKRFHQVLNVFEVWQEDQFDFHSFSLRKGMIRAYVDMLRWEDQLRDHPFFPHMAMSAVEAYLLLSNNPDLVYGPMLDGLNGSGLNAADAAAERKKALKKARREQEKLEKAEADRKALAKAAKPTAKADADDAKKEDTDPTGKTLVETKQPLEDAMKFLEPLLEYNPENIRAQCVGFEVYQQRKKYLLATKCLLAIQSLDADNASLHLYTHQIRQVLASKSSTPEVTTQIREIITSEAKSILQLDFDTSKWNESFLQSHKNSVKHLHAYVAVNHSVDSSASALESNEKKLIASASTEGIELDDAIAGLDLLRSKLGSKPAVIEAYKESARKQWNQADVFQSSS